MGPWLFAMLLATGPSAADPCDAPAKAGRVDEALACLQAETKRDPANLRAWNALGALDAQTKRYDEALAAFDAVLSRAPKDGVAKNGKALVLIATGRADEGFALLGDAIADDPRNVQALDSLGRAALETDRLEVADKAFRQARAVDGKDFDSLLGLGETLLRETKVSDALPLLAAAADAQPSNARAIWMLGKGLAQDDAAKAIPVLERATELSDDPQVWYDLGLARLADARYEAAGYAFTHVERQLKASRSPNDPELVLELGKCELGLGRLVEADLHFEKALALSPPPDVAASIHYQRGLVAEKLDDARTAESEYRAAIAAAPDDALATLNLAVLLAGQKRFAEAEPLLRDLATRPDAAPPIRYDYGLLLLKQGDAASGDAVLQRLVDGTPAGDPWREQAKRLLSGKVSLDALPHPPAPPPDRPPLK